MRNLRKMCFVLVAICLVLVQHFSKPIQYFAHQIQSERILMQTYGDWYNQVGELEYPLTMDDDGWKELDGASGRYEACQIPEDILKSLSTVEILKMIEDYPYFTCMYYYSSIDEGFQALRDNFQAIDELLSRSDSLKVIMKEYAEWIIPADTKFDYEANISEDTKVSDMNEIAKNEEAMRLIRQDGKEKFAVTILELLLATKEVQENLNDSDVGMITESLAEKAEMKSESACYSYDGTTCAYSGSISNEVYVDSSRTVSLVTRSGNSIPFTLAVNPSSYSEDTCLNMISEYYGCELVSVGNKGYNCFAYAWFSLDSTNKPYREQGWVSSQVCFTDDTRYRKTTYANVGYVVSWSGHEGVIKK